MKSEFHAKLCVAVGAGCHGGFPLGSGFGATNNKALVGRAPECRHSEISEPFQGKHGRFAIFLPLSVTDQFYIARGRTH
jgi:hypothetical protein